MENMLLENIKLKAEKVLLTENHKGNMDDLELVEAKIALNTALASVQEYFTEAITVDKVKKHLKDNWKKYALGALAAGAAGAAYKNRDAIKAGAIDLKRKVEDKIGQYKVDQEMKERRAADKKREEIEEDLKQQKANEEKEIASANEKAMNDKITKQILGA